MKTLLTKKPIHPSRPAFPQNLSAISIAWALLLVCNSALAQRPLGVDVSSFQGGSINWSSVKSDGVAFAWTKATEGTTITDPDFTINENNGKAAGVYMGAYHFAHPNTATPAAEAGHFWSVAGGYIKADGLTFMPMLDMEVFSGVDGASSYSDWANQFNNDIVSDAAGNGVAIRPFIYVSACNACEFNSSVAQWLADIADYNGENLYTGTPWSTCTSCEVWGPGVWNAWQVSDSGAISGIPGNVDLDGYNGTLASMAAAAVATANANWYLRNANSAGGANVSFVYGNPGDIPIAGDWTGKGYMSAGVYRSNNFTFYLKNSNTTGAADIVCSFGETGDIPIVGDWTGKGYMSIGVYRPGNATFYLKNSNTSGNADITFAFGDAGDIPVVGDWTGKGYASVGLFRPSNTTFYLKNSNTGGAADITFEYGNPGDVPLAGDWTAQGRTTVGVYRPGNANFYLKNSNSSGTADITFLYGDAGDVPVMGDWDGNKTWTPGILRNP